MSREATLSASAFQDELGKSLLLRYPWGDRFDIVDPEETGHEDTCIINPKFTLVCSLEAWTSCQHLQGVGSESDPICRKTVSRTVEVERRLSEAREDIASVMGLVD